MINRIKNENPLKLRDWLKFALVPLVAGGVLGSALGTIPLAASTPDLSSTLAPESPIHQIPSAQGQLESWGLELTAANEAWRLNRGSRKIIVAVIDTGADLSHPDLTQNLWTNPGESGRDEVGREKSTNGIDDDSNGYIDDVHGWNFVDDNHELWDSEGHGTHIAGIIGARRSEAGKNSDSSPTTDLGVAPEVSLMILKYYDSRAVRLNPLASTIKAIRYATKMGATIINYSGGGLQGNSMEKEAIRLAGEKGILFVAAAGNEHSNSDLDPYFPADYGLSNIASVTAIDETSKILKTSNWGERSVDIAAPGKDILSTLPGGGYGTMTGTSQATAFVTGAAVLLLSHRPELQSPQKLIEHLVATGESKATLTGRTKSRTALNLYRALAMGESQNSVSDDALNSPYIVGKAKEN